MKKYVTTKEKCQEQIDQLNNVCDRCGRKIVPIETCDNSGAPTYWAGCFHGVDSGHFTYGVPKEIYESARKLVLDGETGYSSMSKYEYSKGNEDLKIYWIECHTSSIARILQRAEYLKTNKPRYTEEEFMKTF